MSTDIYFIHAITPLHAGVGQGVGSIDLPIARERATQLPYFPGSSFKGTLRGLSGEASPTTRHLFGPDTANASDHAGSVQFSDARLLFFPVRSLRGVFAYITSPLLLKRFIRDTKDGQVRSDLSIESPKSDNDCLVAGSSILENEGILWLEDLKLQARKMQKSQGFQQLGRLLEIDDFEKRVCIVSDDILSFLVETATELVARIRLDDEKLTVARGALWYEESLPAESILSGIVHTRTIGHPEKPLIGAKDALAEVHKLIQKHRSLQLGGKATVGRGVCRLTLAGGSQ